MLPRTTARRRRPQPALCGAGGRGQPRRCRGCRHRVTSLEPLQLPFWSRSACLKKPACWCAQRITSQHSICGHVPRGLRGSAMAAPASRTMWWSALAPQRPACRRARDRRPRTVVNGTHDLQFGRVEFVDSGHLRSVRLDAGGSLSLDTIWLWATSSKIADVHIALLSVLSSTQSLARRTRTWDGSSWAAMSSNLLRAGPARRPSRRRIRPVFVLATMDEAGLLGVADRLLEGEPAEHRHRDTDALGSPPGMRRLGTKAVELGDERPPRAQDGLHKSPADWCRNATRRASSDGACRLHGWPLLAERARCSTASLTALFCPQYQVAHAGYACKQDRGGTPHQATASKNGTALRPSKIRKLCLLSPS